jgi:hypothetical protein
MVGTSRASGAPGISGTAVATSNVSSAVTESICNQVNFAQKVQRKVDRVFPKAGKDDLDGIRTDADGGESPDEVDFLVLLAGGKESISESS